MVIDGIAAGNPQQIMALVIGVLVGILTLAILFWLTRRKKRGRTIMIAGICESGKTSMFARLVHKKSVATYTSARDNFGTNTVVVLYCPLFLIRTYSVKNVLFVLMRTDFCPFHPI